MFTPRPKQKKILEYSGGWMGVSAVPGSGKTWTLSCLAAEIVSRGWLKNDQEVLVVTLTNSSIDNFNTRVGDFVQGKGLLPYWGYRVRTLHGLANDIVRERPDLVGLDNNFVIVDEQDAGYIRRAAVEAWLRSHPDFLNEYLDPGLSSDKLRDVRRKDLPQLVENIASGFIRYAKDKQLSPKKIQERLEELPVPLKLAQIGAAIYSDYQRGLEYRGGLDFDDLIGKAYYILNWDDKFLQRLQYQWPYILEDEAQDSSKLQEDILRKIVGPQGNWVRVGDPNQAIFETFTTADPKYLREFIQQENVISRDLPNSGRSTHSIINLANHLVEWTMNQHPVVDVRNALSAPPFIEPTPQGDPQINPQDQPELVKICMMKYKSDKELELVAASVVERLKQYPDETTAVLVPSNYRGEKLVVQLEGLSVEPVELLRTTNRTRSAAGVLANVLNYLADPKSSKYLAAVYKVWMREEYKDDNVRKRLEKDVKLIRNCHSLENYLWPKLENDWLKHNEFEVNQPERFQRLIAFREFVRKCQKAVLLPIDQLILSLAQELFSEQTDLALSHRLAVLLRQNRDAHPDWTLARFTHELAEIAKNKRRFTGFDETDKGFDPDGYKGRVVVSTMHKSKGLEWDCVYLTSVNNYDFPSGHEYDEYIAERDFIRDDLNMGAEILAQLDALISSSEFEWYQEGVASQEARLDYVRERLRLLYVGITRAKKELIITWNTGSRNDKQPASALVDLQTFAEKNGMKVVGDE